MRVICQCSNITFPTPTPEPLAVYHCHCTECQKQSASAFGMSAIFPADGLFPLEHDLKQKLGIWTRPSKEGRTMDCYFCLQCGVRIMHRIREPDGKERETVSIKGGVVEGLNWKGAKHIYTGSAVVPIPEDVESYPESPATMEGREENNKPDKA
ncbi:Mss4-like protein [Podospora fimiseda]|uniref:Mss4-like protein n=1 Tax=Podospora fimiseda TaxID=252190 RepID=A0AAN6YN89_9PEZI|nr:Mss4-like protein [Podospora fimiseda]